MTSACERARSRPPRSTAAPQGAARLGLPVCLAAGLMALAPRALGDETATLESGIDLAWQARRAETEVHGTVRVHAGPEQERADQVGLSQLMVDVLAKSGGDGWPRAKIDAWLAERGASLELELEGNGIALDFRCPPDALDEALAICADLLAHPSYPERALESSKNRLVARLGKVAPSAVAERALAEALGGDEASGARLADRADVSQLAPADLEAFHRQHVRGGALSVALNGPLEDGVEALVAEAFAELESGAAAADGAVPKSASGFPEAGYLYHLGRAPHAELRAAVVLPATLEPRAEAALRLYAGYHTPPPNLRRPSVAAEIDELIDVEFRDGLLVAALGAPNELALPAAARLRAALTPPAPAPEADASSAAEGEDAGDHGLDAQRFAEARAGALAQLAPADDGRRLGALLADRRKGRGPDDAAAVAAAAAELDPAEMLAEVGALLSAAEVLVVTVADVAQAPSLAELAVVRSGVRQPRGDGAALDLRAELLAAVGGPDLWDGLRTVKLTGSARIPQLEEPITVAIQRDLMSGALVIDQTVQGTSSTTVSTAQASWLRNGSNHVPLDEARHRALKHAEQRQLFRLLAAVARGRELRLSAEGRRLDLWRGAERFAWIELGADGLPAAVGHEGDRRLVGEPSRTELGDWRSEPIPWPARMTQPAKQTEHAWDRLEIDVPIDPAILVRPGG